MNQIGYAGRKLRLRDQSHIRRSNRSSQREPEKEAS